MNNLLMMDIRYTAKMDQCQVQLGSPSDDWSSHVRNNVNDFFRLLKSPIPKRVSLGALPELNVITIVPRIPL